MPLPEEPSRLERQTKRLRGWFCRYLAVRRQNEYHLTSAPQAVYCAGDSPACSAFAFNSQWVELSCGADGSQPIFSARTLKSIKCPLNFDASASGERSSCAVSFFITPLAGMVVEKRSAVHLTRWAVPVQRKGQRLTGLRTQFLLTHIVRSSRRRFVLRSHRTPDVNHPAVVHVHVIPVVNASPEDDHRTAMRFVRGIGKLTGDLFDMTAWHAGNLLAPGRV